MASIYLGKARKLGFIKEGTQRKMVMMILINDKEGENTVIYIINREVLLFHIQTKVLFQESL